MGKVFFKDDDSKPKRKGFWGKIKSVGSNAKKTMGEGFTELGKTTAMIKEGANDAKNQVLESAYREHPTLGKVIDITFSGASVVLKASTFATLGPAAPLLTKLAKGEQVNMRELGVELAMGMTGLNSSQQKEMLPFLVKTASKLSGDLFENKSKEETDQIKNYGALRMAAANATQGRYTDSKVASYTHYLNVLNYLTEQNALFNTKSATITYQTGIFSKLNKFDSLKGVSQNDKMEISEGITGMMLKYKGTHSVASKLFANEDAMKTFSAEFNREFKSDTIANNFPEEDYGKLYKFMQSALTQHGLNTATKSGSSSQSLSLEPSTTSDSKSFYTKLFDGKEFTTWILGKSSSYGGKTFFKITFYDQSNRKIKTLGFSEYLGDENICDEGCGKCDILSRITNLNINVLHSGEIDVYFNLEGVYDEQYTDDLKVFGYMWTNKKTLFDGKEVKNAILTLDE